MNKQNYIGLFEIGQQGFVIYLVLIITFVIGLYIEMIIGAHYVAVVGIQHKMVDLQAKICASSGLSMAMACVDGYDGHDFSWQAEKVTRSLVGGGSFSLNTVHKGGWLQVTSTGLLGKDTCVLTGTLGQAAPSFTANALNLAQSISSVVIGDRATISGDIGTTGGNVITRGNGFFRGRVQRLQNVVYNESIVEEDVAQAAEVFESGKQTGFITAAPALAAALQSMHATGTEQLTINSDVSIQSDTIDCKKATIWIRGNLLVSQSACLKNGEIRVAGKIGVQDAATIKACSIVSFGNISITGRTEVQGNLVGCDSIVVGDNARLAFPSFIYLSSYRINNLPVNGVIIAKDNAVICGTVATARFGLASEPKMLLLGRAKLEGFLACPGAGTIYGSARGSLFMGQNSYKYQHSIFENWFKEATITSVDLSAMAVPLLFPIEGHPKYLQIVENGKSHE